MDKKIEEGMLVVVLREPVKIGITKTKMPEVGLNKMWDLGGFGVPEENLIPVELLKDEQRLDRDEIFRKRHNTIIALLGIERELATKE